MVGLGKFLQQVVNQDLREKRKGRADSMKRMLMVWAMGQHMSIDPSPVLRERRRLRGRGTWQVAGGGTGGVLGLASVGVKEILGHRLVIAMRFRGGRVW